MEKLSSGANKSALELSKIPKIQEEDQGSYFNDHFQDLQRSEANIITEKAMAVQ